MVCIALDVMGADNPPAKIVQGGVNALRRDPELSVLFVGSLAAIDQVLIDLPPSMRSRATILPAEQYVTMNDSASCVLRKKNDSSIVKAFEAVKAGEARAVVSPANTGAMMIAGYHVLGMIAGVSRPAIVTLLPTKEHGKHLILLDSGANVDCSVSYLVQFAVMGSAFAQTIFDLALPKVGILSNGSESGKGTDLLRGAANVLSNIDINYVGFVEGRDLADNVADVIVTDGFVGNVVLKTIEGTVDFVIDAIKQVAKRSMLGAIGLKLAKGSLKRLFSEELNPSYYGGALLMGLNGIGIVCHGSADETAIANGILMAKRYVEKDLIGLIDQQMNGLDFAGFV